MWLLFIDGKLDWIELAKDISLITFILGGIAWLEIYL